MAMFRANVRVKFKEDLVDGENAQFFYWRLRPYVTMRSYATGTVESEILKQLKRRYGLNPKLKDLKKGK